MAPSRTLACGLSAQSHQKDADENENKSKDPERRQVFAQNANGCHRHSDKNERKQRLHDTEF